MQANGVNRTLGCNAAEGLRSLRQVQSVLGSALWRMAVPFVRAQRLAVSVNATADHTLVGDLPSTNGLPVSVNDSIAGHHPET